MNKGIILGDGLNIRQPTIQEKLNIVMQRCDHLQSQINGCLMAINDLSAGIQKAAMSPQQRAGFIKEMFKIQLHRTAVQCQMTLEAGQLGPAAKLRKLLDTDYKKQAKDVQALSYYHKIMRKLERGTLIPKPKLEEEALEVVKPD